MLSATDWSAPAETGVRMTITDADGRDVFHDGRCRRRDAQRGRVPRAGPYTVRFTRANEQGGVLQPLLFQLSGKTLSDPHRPPAAQHTSGAVESAAAPVTPEVTFYWLPYRPAELAARACRPRRRGPGVEGPGPRTASRRPCRCRSLPVHGLRLGGLPGRNSPAAGDSTLKQLAATAPPQELGRCGRFPHSPSTRPGRGETPFKPSCGVGARATGRRGEVLCCR